MPRAWRPARIAPSGLLAGKGIAVVELTPEEERSLKELVEAYGRGESVKDFVNNRLYGELSHVTGKDRHGNVTRSYEPGFKVQHQVYGGLCEKGLLAGSKPPHPAMPFMFGDLTSEGRCYFEMKEAARRAERSRIWSDRRFQIGLSVFTLLFSAAISTAISLYNKPSAEPLAYQQPQQLAQGHAQADGES